jgi:hypothetical protein
MTNDSAAIRSVVVYAICLPLAIILGYLIATGVDPRMDKQSVMFLGIVLFVLVLPLFFRFYHVWLIAIWNMSITCQFLPGVLPGWMPMALLGFTIAIGHYILNRQRRFLPAPWVSRSLIFIALVVYVTAKLRGGIGMRALGDEAIGGKRYFFIWTAVIGYFALTSQTIPARKRNLYALLFLLGGLTSVIGEIADKLGPAFSFVYVFFPMGDSAITHDYLMGDESVVRYGGLADASKAVAFALVLRYGLEGILNLKKLWRPFVFFAALFLITFGGFRATFILIGATLGLVFYFEGLLRSRLMPIVLLGCLLTGGLVVAFSDQLPRPFQRCLAFLPLKLDPVARQSAEASSDWRLEIWRSVIPQIPQYLLLGKGLTMDANELASYQTLGNSQVGGLEGGGFTLAGDYHNGPLSVIIPFGIAGCIAVLWFFGASLKALWANYKYGDPDARHINTFLLSFFIAKILLFFFVFGGFYGDFPMFVGVIGFSVSLNGGVAKPVPVHRPRIALSRFRILPTQAPATGA